MKKIISSVILLTLLSLTGCANNQTKMLVQQQNQEVLQLQKVKNDILMRPTRNAKELLQKKAELKIVNDEIVSAQKAQANAQQISNEQTNNNVKGVLTGVGAVLGTIAVIDNVLK